MTAPAGRRRRASKSAVPEISIVIPTSNRLEWLKRCLTSLAAQVDPPPFELLVCAPPDPEVHALVTSLIPDASVVPVPHATPAERRNAVLPLACGEVVLFLDDDVEVPPHYLATLGEFARRHPDVTVFGGPNVTPEGSTRFQDVQGAVLSSLIGTGPARRRYGPHPTTEADERWFTLCNLAIRRTEASRFDSDLVCAEENELLDRLRRSGARMRYAPELWVSHDRRPTMQSFGEQMYKYGHGRGQLARRSSGTLRLPHLVPTATIFVIVALALAAPISGQPLLAVPIGAYLLALATQGVVIATGLRRPAAFLPAIGITMALHASYGTGIVIGLLEPREGPARKSPFHQWRLLRVLAYRQLRLLRSRSLIGLLWPMLTPWVMLALYTFVFHSVLNVPIPRYGVFLFAGLLPWSFLSQTLGFAVNSLSIDADVVRRSRFSYWLLPVATELALSTYFFATLAIFVGYLGVQGELPWGALPWIVLPIASLYLFVGAISCVLALIDVYNRDIRQVLGNLLTIWFFLVPIVYQQQMLSDRLLFMRSIDPINLIVGEFRNVLYDGHLAQPLHSVIVLAASGLLFFLATGLINRAGASLPKDI